MAAKNRQWAFACIVKFLSAQKARYDAKEITAGTLRNYYKPLRVFCEANDVEIAWLKITRGLPRPRKFAQDRAPPIITTDFVYLRFIGDRSIPDHEFGKIQKDRTREMQEWVAELNKVVDTGLLFFSVVAQNNHYAGFGPASVNIFRRLVGLPEVQFAGEKNQPKLAESGI